VLPSLLFILTCRVPGRLVLRFRSDHAMEATVAGRVQKLCSCGSRPDLELAGDAGTGRPHVHRGATPVAEPGTPRAGPRKRALTGSILISTSRAAAKLRLVGAVVLPSATSPAAARLNDTNPQLRRNNLR
jgi:hypothetical protein